MKMDRVKFYSVNDLMYSYYLQKSESLLQEYEAGKEVNDINDLIELYNVKKYIDNKIYPSVWKSDDINRYQTFMKSCFSDLAKYFNSMTKDSFVSIYNNVEFNNKDDFWELINKFKVYENISNEVFIELLNLDEVWLHSILKYKNITEYFGKSIREYMLSTSSTAELLLDTYEIDAIDDREQIFFPKSLSNLDKETIISNYIDSESPNLNFIRIIANIQSNKDKLVISPKILLKAKRKSEQLEKEIFQDSTGIAMEIIVKFSESQKKVINRRIERQSITVTYSLNWIKKNTDYPTLLNNFIYLFDFVDLQMRFTLVNKFNEMGVFERYMITNSQNAYKKGIAFDRNNILSLIQTKGYYTSLLDLGIRCEDIIEWFFHEYLSTEFDAYDFQVIMPSSSSTHLEKCTTIMPALESVLKQFALYVEESQIDVELLSIRTEHLLFKNIPSLIDKKYAYGIGDEYKISTNLLFSDQSGLTYDNIQKKSYKNFYEFICDKKYKQHDYPDYFISKINWLIEHEYLYIDEQGYVLIYNELLMLILKDLFYNEVISYWKYSENGRIIMDEFAKKNIIKFENSLFTRPEQDCLNYFLNKAKFNNGLDLRNKYSHTQPSSQQDEKHNQNYMIFLRFFILTIIKINDEFCTYNQIKVPRNDFQ